MRTRAYTLGLYEKAMPSQLNWKEKLQTAKSTGYDFIEISIDETDEKLSRLNMSRDERRMLVELMEDAKIPIQTMCLSGHRKYPLGSSNPVIEKAALTILEKAVELALDLGIRIIQLAGYDVYYETSSIQTLDRFQRNLRTAVHIAAKSGVMLGFETMETEFMNTVGKAMKYVRLICSPYLNIYPDSGNLTNASLMYNSDVFEDLRSGKGHIAAMHLKETVPGVYRDVPFGAGHVDFKNIIETVWSMGVRKYVAEFWYMGSDNWISDIKDANQRMTDILDGMPADDRN